MSSLNTFLKNQINIADQYEKQLIITTVCQKFNADCIRGSFSFIKEAQGVQNILTVILANFYKNHCDKNPQCSICQQMEYMLEEDIGQLKYYLKDF